MMPNTMPDDTRVYPRAGSNFNMPTYANRQCEQFQKLLVESSNLSVGTNFSLGDYMATKQTAKSCSCGQCTRGKHTKSGHEMMRLDERKFRHNAKIALNKGAEDIGIAPKGNYYD